MAHQDGFRRVGHDRPSRGNRGAGGRARAGGRFEERMAKRFHTHEREAEGAREENPESRED